MTIRVVVSAHSLCTQDLSQPESALANAFRQALSKLGIDCRTANADYYPEDHRAFSGQPARVLTGHTEDSSSYVLEGESRPIRVLVAEMSGAALGTVHLRLSGKFKVECSEDSYLEIGAVPLNDPIKDVPFPTTPKA